MGLNIDDLTTSSTAFGSEGRVPGKSPVAAAHQERRR